MILFLCSISSTALSLSTRLTRAKTQASSWWSSILIIGFNGEKDRWTIIKKRLSKIHSTRLRHPTKYYIHKNGRWTCNLGKFEKGNSKAHSIRNSLKEVNLTTLYTCLWVIRQMIGRLRSSKIVVGHEGFTSVRKKPVKSIIFEDLSRNAVIFRTNVKP